MFFAPQEFKNYAFIDSMDERILLKPGATTHAALMTRDDLAFLVGVFDVARGCRHTSEYKLYAWQEGLPCKDAMPCEMTSGNG